MRTDPKNFIISKAERSSSKKRLPYVPTKDELLKILAYVEDARLGFVIFSSCFQGFRIGELATLKWSEVDLINGEVRVLDGKNTKRFKSGYGRDRIIPINEMFLKIWKAWRLMNPHEEYVIPSEDKFGIRSDIEAVTRQCQKKLHDALEKADMLVIEYYQINGIPRYKYHLHSFRHVCGSNLRRAGMKLDDIRDFLGHEDIETTELYTDLTKDDLREASHIAYAYPKSHLGLPQISNNIQVTVDKDTLVLQKEILDKQLELARLQMNGLRVKEVEMYEH